MTGTRAAIYETPLRELAEGAGKDGKVRMIFELLLPTYYLHNDDKHMMTTST
jgi:hypothetical protein